MKFKPMATPNYTIAQRVERIKLKYKDTVISILTGIFLIVVIGGAESIADGILSIFGL